jgi:hypothetical protein
MIHTIQLKMQYKIVADGIQNYAEFQSNVTKRLNEGWQLHGGLIVSSGGLYQALIKTISPYEEGYEEGGEVCNQK